MGMVSFWVPVSEIESAGLLRGRVDAWDLLEDERCVDVDKAWHAIHVALTGGVDEVDTPLGLCERRDPKGLYRRARAGEIAEFTGISSPYEAPEAPELTVDTAALDIEACLERLLDYVRRTIVLAD